MRNYGEAICSFAFVLQHISKANVSVVEESFRPDAAPDSRTLETAVESIKIGSLSVSARNGQISPHIRQLTWFQIDIRKSECRTFGWLFSAYRSLKTHVCGKGSKKTATTVIKRGFCQTDAVLTSPANGHTWLAENCLASTPNFLRSLAG